MKKLFIFLFANVMAINFAFSQSQGAAINTNGNPADPSALLDVNSTTAPYQGTLITRLTTVQRNGIISPAAGLLIFNTTTNCFEAFVIGAWYPVSCPVTCTPPAPVGVITGSMALCENTTATFSITTVTGASTYIWTVPAGMSISSGQGTTSISINSGSPGSNGNVIVIAGNSCGASSASLTVSVNPNLPVSLSIAASPSGAVCPGTSVTFTTIPTNGGSSPSYQWKVNGSNAGTNSSAFTISTLINGDQVSCAVTSNAPCITGSPATSNAITMTVNPNLPVSVNIAASPSGAICSGTSVTFTATPTNSGTLPTYQWKNGGSVISGATNSTYTSTTLANSDAIACVMTSNANCVTGSPATSGAITMTVNAPPTTATNGSTQTICTTGSATLSGNNPSIGTGAWTVVSGPSTLPSQFASTTVNNTIFTPAGGAGSYVVRWTISNSPCISSSADATITVNAPPTIANAGPDINPACGVTIATLAGNTPLVGTGTWSLISGTATITTPGSPTSGITGLAVPGIATLRWTISNSPCATSTDDVIITTSACGFTCGSTLTDNRNSQTYSTVLIGTQCWMKQNLNYHQSTFGNDWCYNNDANNCNIYGRLYDWTAAMQGAPSSSSNPSGVQGICPSGWHFPSDAEFCQLENQVEPGTDPSCNITDWRGVNTSGNLKEIGTSHWYSPNEGATNSSGFTALPAGTRYPDGSFNYYTMAGYFWCSTEIGNYAWIRYLHYGMASIYRYNNTKELSFSVRCVKN